MTWPGWERQLLGALGISPTPARLSFLIAWQACEGGTAHFNPLNTTFTLSHSGLYNDAGVRNYRDELEGLAATLLTLRLPYYEAMLHALRAPNLTALEIAQRSSLALATWGTGSRCVLRKLSSH